MQLPPGAYKGEGSKKPWDVPRIWEGETVWVLGAGPSLALVEPYRDILKKKKVIAVNNAFKIGDIFDISFFGDARHYWEYQDEEDSFKGLKVSFNIHYVGLNKGRSTIEGLSNIKIINRSKTKAGLTNDPHCLCYNGSSGGSAINLASRLGAKKIILIGLDLKMSNGKLHYVYNRHNKPCFLEKLKNPQLWKAIDRDAKQQGIQIVNVSNDSDMPIIARTNIKDVLKW
jgi:hypothetical protein